MRVTKLKADHSFSTSSVDVHFEDIDSAKRFSNYCLSLTGKECIFHDTYQSAQSTVWAKIYDVSEYPFTVANYVEKQIVESFLNLFPEENENV